MTPTKKADTPEGNAAGAGPTADLESEPSEQSKVEPSAAPQKDKQSTAPARPRRKPARSPADSPATADSSEGAVSKRRSPVRKKGSEQAAAGASQPPQEAAEQAVLRLPPLLENGKLKKKERNVTHEKKRVYIRKDLIPRLDRLAQHHGKGFKTLLINYALEKALDDLEQAVPQNQIQSETMREG